MFKRGENALILHIKALHTLKLELSYNLDDFHFFPQAVHHAIRVK